MDKIIKLCKAAKIKGVETKVFFTHTGTRLCTDKRMKGKKMLHILKSEPDDLQRTLMYNLSLGYNCLQFPLHEFDDMNRIMKNWSTLSSGSTKSSPGGDMRNRQGPQKLRGR